MTPSSLRLSVLVAVTALLVGGAACAETPEPAQDDSIEAVRTRANAGDAEAQVTLEVMHAEGRGVPQDAVEAVAWYRKAAEQAVADAQYNLGVMYAEDRGVPQDAVEATAWWRKAAEQGLAEAQANLGVMYADGRGVRKDDVEAYKWLNLASTYTNAPKQEDFAEVRDLILERLTPEQRAEGQKLAREWFAAHLREP